MTKEFEYQKNLMHDLLHDIVSDFIDNLIAPGQDDFGTIRIIAAPDNIKMPRIVPGYGYRKVPGY